MRTYIRELKPRRDDFGSISAQAIEEALERQMVEIKDGYDLATYRFTPTVFACDSVFYVQVNVEMVENVVVSLPKAPSR